MPVRSTLCSQEVRGLLGMTAGVGAPGEQGGDSAGNQAARWASRKVRPSLPPASSYLASGTLSLPTPPTPCLVGSTTCSPLHTYPPSCLVALSHFDSFTRSQTQGGHLIGPARGLAVPGIPGWPLDGDLPVAAPPLPVGRFHRKPAL